MLFIVYLSYIFLIQPLLGARAEIQKYFRWFLVQMKSLEFSFKINWPLKKSNIYLTKMTKLSNSTKRINMKVEYNATIQAQVLVMTVVFFKEFMILNPFDYQVPLQKYLTKMTKKSNNTKRYSQRTSTWILVFDRTYLPSTYLVFYFY